MFGAQDGTCCDGGTGIPLGLDLQNHNSPEQNPDQQEAKDKDGQDGEGVESR